MSWVLPLTPAASIVRIGTAVAAIGFDDSRVPIPFFLRDRVVIYVGSGFETGGALAAEAIDRAIEVEVRRMARRDAARQGSHRY